jgi:hypothetical protein
MHRLIQRLALAGLGIDSPSEAEGSMPSDPVSIAAISESMSPNRLSVTMTSTASASLHEIHAAGIGELMFERRRPCIRGRAPA